MLRGAGLRATPVHDKNAQNNAGKEVPRIMLAMMEIMVMMGAAPLAGETWTNEHVQVLQHVVP